MAKLDGKVVLITGGGTGIGKGIGELFASEGAHVVICGRRVALLEGAAAEISKRGRACTFFQCDIGNEQSVTDMFTSIIEKFGKIDVLINNASVVGQIAPIENIDIPAFEQALNANLTGMIICSKLAVKYMKEKKSGSIINISSNTGRRGAKNRTPYTCSKWAMEGMTKTIALETGSFGIRCNSICPGPVMTERLEGAVEKMSKVRNISEEQIFDEWRAQSPMGRFATIEECAQLSLFLATDASGCMTGQSLDATCGVLMN